MRPVGHGNTIKMKITKRQLRRIIREEKQKLRQEGIFQGAIDSVSDFFTGDETVRAIDPAKAEKQLRSAVATYVGSKVQDAVSKGANTSDFQRLFDDAIDMVDKIVDDFAQEGHDVEVQKQ